MTVTRINGTGQVITVEKTQTRLVDFNRIQVAPEPQKKQEEFKALSLSERQELLQKLINRVKSL